MDPRLHIHNGNHSDASPSVNPQGGKLLNATVILTNLTGEQF